MGFEFIKKLPTPAEIKQQYPVPEKVAQIKKERDKQIQDVFTGNSDKFLVIIGPCSADNEESVCDYIRRLIPVQEKVKDKLILIPRIYTNRVPPVTATRDWYTSPTRRRSQTCWPVLSPCAICTSVPWRKAA